MTAWMNKAACLPVDPEVFEEAGEEAQLVCAGCPVVAECKAYADMWEPYDNSEWYEMVYGGETPEQRVARRGDSTVPTPFCHPKKPLAEFCINGHAWSEENTYIRPASGQRHCRACNRAATSRTYFRRKARRALEG